MTLSILQYGDCTSSDGRLERMSDYRGVGLQRFDCMLYLMHGGL